MMYKLPPHKAFEADSAMLAMLQVVVPWIAAALRSTCVSVNVRACFAWQRLVTRRGQSHGFLTPYLSSLNDHMT